MYIKHLIETVDPLFGRTFILQEQVIIIKYRVLSSTECWRVVRTHYKISDNKFNEEEPTDDCEKMQHQEEKNQNFRVLVKSRNSAKLLECLDTVYTNLNM